MAFVYIDFNQDKCLVIVKYFLSLWQHIPKIICTIYSLLPQFLLFPVLFFVHSSTSHENNHSYYRGSQQFSTYFFSIRNDYFFMFLHCQTALLGAYSEFLAPILFNGPRIWPPYEFLRIFFIHILHS